MDYVTIFCNPVTLLNFLKTLALELNYKMKTLIYLKKDLVGFVARIKLRCYKPNNSIK